MDVDDDVIMEMNLMGLDLNQEPTDQPRSLDVDIVAYGDVDIVAYGDLVAEYGRIADWYVNLVIDVLWYSLYHCFYVVSTLDFNFYSFSILAILLALEVRFTAPHFSVTAPIYPYPQNATMASISSKSSKATPTLISYSQAYFSVSGAALVYLCKDTSSRCFHSAALMYDRRIAALLGEDDSTGNEVVRDEIRNGAVYVPKVAVYDH
ncbi:hypothetical protein PHJA_000068900 [Phtheirospermum japonicum]|uniref:Uncharacterized protein n=1 Tax=Phtheirospermum japonicum TaxID=374723 RepID=A0A830B441_9LAMI|nr:hypothetical protein PHJA_000068900 [Phtheirospermum japonicum]